jgi:hypothetical protein
VPAARSLCRRLLTALTLAIVPTAACRSAAPPNAVAPARSADVPLVALTYPPASACAPIEAKHGYDEEAYAYAKRVDEVAAEIGRSFQDAGGGAPGASAAAARLRDRRAELEGAWRGICGALPDHVGAPTLNLLQAKTSAAIYRVCTAPVAKAGDDAPLRASLGQLCDDFRAAIGQPASPR